MCCIAAMCLNEIFMRHKERRRSPLLCEGSSFYLLRRVFLTSYQMRIPRVLLGAHRAYKGERCIIPGFSMWRAGPLYFDIFILSLTVVDFPRAHECFARIYLRSDISERTTPYMPRANNAEDKVGTGRPVVATRSSSRQVSVIKTFSNSMYRNKALLTVYCQLDKSSIKTAKIRCSIFYYNFIYLRIKLVRYKFILLWYHLFY